MGPLLLSSEVVLSVTPQKNGTKEAKRYFQIAKDLSRDDLSVLKELARIFIINKMQAAPFWMPMRGR